uniref:uncharacterized protein LOC124054203 n=1 Tax=Scatophagus argus TaxID=75038 RepID=UPI001ED7DC61|nr:uncharacterized protein LOC124054203 [Scatophagus argus]
MKMTVGYNCKNVTDYNAVNILRNSVLSNSLLIPDQMIALPLTAIVFAVALVQGQQREFSYGKHVASDLEAVGCGPCEQNSDMTAYNIFVKRHILQENFERSSLKAWKSYLESHGLCGRVPVQSFIEAGENEVLQICRDAGRRVKGNLCISESLMTVHDVKSQKMVHCNVSSVNSPKRKVIVACDKINNLCFPVHYQTYGYQQPGNETCNKYKNPPKFLEG